MLQQRGIQLDAGLTSTEIALAEERVGAQFPADLQALLAAALPVSRGFPNWRRPEDPDLEVQLSGPLEGIKFGITTFGGLPGVPDRLFLKKLSMLPRHGWRPRHG